MADEQRLQPETIVFHSGIRADAACESEDFADLINFVPPSDGGAGLQIRLPLAAEDVLYSVSETAPTVALVSSDADAGVEFPKLLAICGQATADGTPIAGLFPHFDVINRLPDTWQTVSGDITP